jgi:hypothetical protein
MTDSPLDAPQADGLARAFQLPTFIQEDAGLSGLYDYMVDQLRREASGLPMNTLQQLLIERIASFYVHIKYKEENAGFTTANQQKEYNTEWRNLLVEFNRLLTASDDKLRTALLTEIQKLVTDSIRLVTNDEERRAVRRELAGGFAALQL